MSDLLDGVDVSKWQREMDWPKCAGAGAKFAFIRAGSIDNITGECYTDYQFEANQEAAEYMPIGFYWYFRPNHNPKKQADYFCDLIRDKKFKLPPVMDLETNGDLSPGEVTNSAASFVLRIHENLNVMSLLYSRGEWLNNNTIPDEFMMLLDLWIARYTFKGKPWGNILPWPDLPRIKPRDYDEWKFWQWSADGNGRGAEFGASSKSIDLNRFNGDQAAFDKYIGAEPVQPKIVEVKTDKNGLLFSHIGGDYKTVVPYKLRLGVVGVDKDDKDRDWYDIGGLWIPSWYVKVIE